MSLAVKRIAEALSITSDVLYDKVGAGIIFGTVTSIKPLAIQIENRKTVTEDFIVLSPFCIRAEFDNYVPTYQRAGGSNAASFASHNHDFHVGLWRGLQIGDGVVIVMSSDKQMYYVLHRIDMVFGDMGGG